jgi:hypothetical protein
MRILPYILIVSIWVFSGYNAESQTNVTLQPNLIRDIGGYSEVQEIFGVMTSSIDPRAKLYLENANITGVREIFNWLPNPNTPGFNFKHPYWSTRTPKFDTEQETMDWFDGFIARDPSLWNDLVQGAAASLLNDDYGAVNVTICGSPTLFDGRLERNPEAARAHIVAYVQALKNARPANAESRVATFSLHNEPEQERNWSGQFGRNQQLMIESYMRVYNNLYDEVSKNHPDVIFVGPTIGHAGAFLINDRAAHPGVNWNVLVKYYIDNALNPDALKYFNVHCYNIPPGRSHAFISMTQNYSYNTRGVKPRLIITETGAHQLNNVTTNYRNQFAFMAEDIMMMLHNPDKYAVRHSYVASSGDPTTHSIFHSAPEGVTPQAQYYVLYTWRNVRGKNISLDVDNKKVQVFATSPDDRKVVVALFNPENESKMVNIDLGLSAEDISSIIQRKAVWSDLLINAEYSDMNIGGQSTLSVSMEPLSIYALEIDLAKALSRSVTALTREYYGSMLNTDLSVSRVVNIAVPELPGDKDSVFLRVGIHERFSSTEDYPIKINGHIYNYNLSQLPPLYIRPSGHWNTAAYIEIPVNKAHLGLSNSIELPALGSNRVLMYSSLVFVENSMTTSIQPPISGTSLKLYPNPVSEVLSIENPLPSGKEWSLSIMNIHGQEMYRKSLSVSSSNDSVNLDVAHLPSGMYICRVESGKSLTTIKFIKN